MSGLYAADGSLNVTLIGTIEGDMTITGEYYAGNGAVGSPSYSFASDPDTGIYRVGTNALGFSVGGTGRWQINANGHILAITDNTYDIGAAGATRPRTLHVGTSINVPLIAVGQTWLTDGITAPGATVGAAKIYVDSADGDLKVVFGDGVVKTIATDA